MALEQRLDALDRVAGRILGAQRAAIEKAIGRAAQLVLDFSGAEKAQREQLEKDRDYMEQRLVDIEREIETEPGQIEGLYRVAVRRLEPVGLMYLWPEARE